MKMHKGMHSIASEWSWQTVLSFFCFSLFQVHDFGRNCGCLLIWRWMQQCSCSSIFPIFADSSWRGNREETSLSQITCNGQLQISHFISVFISVLLSLPCVGILLRTFLSLPPNTHLHFDLHEKHTTFPLVPAFLHSFSNERRKDEQSTRKGSSLCIHNHNQLFVIPTEYKDGHKLKFRV